MAKEKFIEAAPAPPPLLSDWIPSSLPENLGDIKLIAFIHCFELKIAATQMKVWMKVESNKEFP